jgi:hypothetical protein
MLESCSKHPHEKGVSLCRRCGHGWCSNCLVYAFGPKKPPYCMSCAMLAGGVKSTSSMPAMSKRQLKAQMRAVKAEAKAAATGAPAPAEATEPAGEEQTAAACATTDWSSPWWEDRQPAALAD